MNIKSCLTPPEGPIDMEALNEKIQKTLERRQKTAFLAGFLASCERPSKDSFLAGFLASCESWNGEYPYEGSGAAWRDGVGSAYARWVKSGRNNAKRPCETKMEDVQ